MKILHFHWRYDRYGGGERYLIDLCSALEEKGHETVIVSSRSQDHFHDKRKKYFIDGSFGIRSGMMMWKTVKEIVWKEEPDLIHLHETLVFLSPFIVRKLMRIKPVVQTLHTAFFFARRVPRYCPTRRYVITPWEGCVHIPAVFERRT